MHQTDQFACAHFSLLTTFAPTYQEIDEMEKGMGTSGMIPPSELAATHIPVRGGVF